MAAPKEEENPDEKLKAAIAFREVTNLKLGLPFDIQEELGKTANVKQEHPYVNYNVVKFPLIIDAESVIFAGRIGETPTYGRFSLRNPMNIHWHYKIKCSSNFHFRVFNPVGIVRKHDRVTVEVMAYPVKPVPKPFTHYFHVYVRMGVLGEDPTPLLVWQPKMPDLRRRLYADFFYHPNIDRARAALMASEIRGLHKTTQKYRIVEETNRIREACSDLLMKMLENDAIRAQMEPISDYESRMKNVALMMNDPRKLREFLEERSDFPNVTDILWPVNSKARWHDLRKRIQKTIPQPKKLDTVGMPKQPEMTEDEKKEKERKRKEKVDRNQRNGKKGKKEEKQK